MFYMNPAGLLLVWMLSGTTEAAAPKEMTDRPLIGE